LSSHRAFGLHTAEPLIALIHLCCGRIRIEVAHEWQETRKETRK